MKLGEQFLNNHKKSGGIGMNEKQSVGCAEIAENFAIGFAEWCLVNKPKYDAGHAFSAFEPVSIKRLLEIYKETL